MQDRRSTTMADDADTALKKKKEEIEKRQKEAKELLKELETLQASGKERTDAKVKDTEAKLRQVLNVPDSKWVSSNDKHVTLDIVIKDLKSQIDDLGTIVTSGTLTNRDVVRNASAGLALKGILVSKHAKDSCYEKQTILEAPKNVNLTGPVMQQHEDCTELSSRFQSDVFHLSLDSMGYSVASSIKGGGWGFQMEAGFSVTHFEEEERQSEVHSTETFQSRVLCSVIPTAAVEFDPNLLKLSRKAFTEMLKIEKASKSEQPDIVQRRCEELFRTFGSHINVGTVHFGGVYKWTATYHSRSQSSRESVRKMVQDSQEAHVSASYSGFGFSAGGSVSASHFRNHSNMSASHQSSELSKIELKMAKTGGPPEINGLPLWRMGLCANNSTWAVIDRGRPSEFKGIWKIIPNHKDEFSDAKALATTIRNAWYKMTEIQSDASDIEDIDINQLDIKMKQCGLDSDYWLPIFDEKLGIKTVEQMKHLRASDMGKLRHYVRHDWEQNALHELLGISEGDYNQFQNQRLEAIKQRQGEAKVLLGELKQLNEGGKTRVDKLVQEKEEKLRMVLNIPKDYWIKNYTTASLSDIMSKERVEFP